MNQANREAQVLIDLGEAMLANGLETDHVEQYVSQVGKSFGLTSVDFLILNAGVACTITLPNGNQITQTRRMSLSSGVNCSKAGELDRLSKECIKHSFSPEELSRRIKEITDSKDSLMVECVGSVIGVAGLTISFGGRPIDALIAAIIALLIALGKNKFKGFFPNTFVFNVVAAFFAGITACGAEFVIQGLLLDKIMSGIVMMLIPGMAFTLAMREVLMGETSIGAMRLIEAVLWGFGLAFGFIAAIVATGVYTDIAPNLNLEGWGFVIKLGCAFASACGFGLMNHLPLRHMPVAPLVGMLSCAICVTLTQNESGLLWANFFAGAFAALCVTALAKYFNTSSVALLVPAIMPLVPGSLLFYGMCCGVAGDSANCIANLSDMMVVALSLSAGTCTIWAIQSIMRKVSEARQAKA